MGHTEAMTYDVRGSRAAAIEAMQKYVSALVVARQAERWNLSCEPENADSIRALIRMYDREYVTAAAHLEQLLDLVGRGSEHRWSDGTPIDAGGITLPDV